MKNREKFKDELLKRCTSGDFDTFFDKYISPTYHRCTYSNTTFDKIIILTMLWLDEEYQEEVDWSKVKVDTPILVSMNGETWYRRYFAEYHNEVVHAFDDGATSWTTAEKTGWTYAKLAEPQKPEHDSCVGCELEHFESDQEPCKDCQHAHMDKYESQE